jgi:hypothetical protein
MGLYEIHLDHAVEYLVEGLLRLIGKDDLTKAKRERISRIIRVASEEAASVQCIGMHKPIPIEKIYQPKYLTGAGETIDIPKLLNAHRDAVVFGRPGQGKTTLLHWVYMQLAGSNQKEFLGSLGKDEQEVKWNPVLFTLRKSEAAVDLGMFVDLLGSRKAPQQVRGQRIALLVDGYDEVSSKQRKNVSHCLSEFKSLKVGNFYLTCRDYYDVFDLRAPQFQLADFDEGDAVKFIESFCNVYGANNVDAPAFVWDLEEHGFSSFLTQPLMIALVCILKTSVMPALPSNTVGLLERVLMFITYKWDEAKGLNRESVITEVDGIERVRCMEQVAYRMTSDRADEQEVLQSMEEHLRLIHCRVDTRKLLTEIAQFYGLLVPTGTGEWAFVHSTIQDYLAARVWAQDFSPRRVQNWNLRAAYATCLLKRGATESLRYALLNSPDVFAVSECLYNRPPFDPVPVGRAFIRHFQKYGNFSVSWRNDKLVEAHTSQDIFHLASEDLLQALINLAMGRASQVHDLVIAYALAELFDRGLRLSSPTYTQLQGRYKSTVFLVSRKRKQVRVEFNLQAMKPSVLRARVAS